MFSFAATMYILIAKKQGPPVSSFVRKSSEAKPERRSPLLLQSRLFSKVFYLACIRHYFPRRQGEELEQRLAGPLHGASTPGRISVGRPPCLRLGLDGSIIIPERSHCETACHRLFSGRMGPLCTFSWPSLMADHISATDGLGASSSVACLSRQEAPSGTYSSLRIFGCQRARGACPLVLPLIFLLLTFF